MNVRSRMIFTSNKSLIVQVVVLCESNRTEDVSSIFSLN